MLRKIIHDYICSMTAAVPAEEAVAQVVAAHPQYSTEEVEAAFERALNPPDTAEGYAKHAEELTRYIKEREATR